MRPQENGNKTDVRWVTLTNAQGVGCWPSGRTPRSVSPRAITPKEDMERAGYTFQMQRHPEIYLNLDWKADGRRRHRQLEPERATDGRPTASRAAMDAPTATA